MRELVIGLACAAIALAGCDEKAPTKKDEPAAEKSDAKDGATKKTSAEAESENAAPEEAKTGIVDGLPAQVAGKLKLPAGREALKGGLGVELFSLEVPKGMAWVKSSGPGQPKTWTELSGGDLTMSLMDHNPSGDDGPGCPSMDDMKKKVAGATTVHDFSFSTETSDDNVSYGDEVKIWVFEKDGKAGFYGIKVFDHGDDATTWCAAPGKKSEAPSLTALVDRAQAEELAAMFASLKFSF